MSLSGSVHSIDTKLISAGGVAMDMWKVSYISGDSPLPEEDQGPQAPTYPAPLVPQ